MVLDLTPRDQVRLTLPTDDFDELHRAADKKAKKVEVDKEALRKLLADHSACITALGGRVRQS